METEVSDFNEKTVIFAIRQLYHIKFAFYAKNMKLLFFWNNISDSTILDFQADKWAVSMQSKVDLKCSG